MNKLLYISTGIPKEEVIKIREKQISFDSNAFITISTFHGNIILGVSESYDEVTALCGVPIDNKNFDIKKYEKTMLKKGNIHYIIPGFINRKFIKQTTQVIKIAIEGIKWALKNRRDKLNIIIDGSYYCGLISLSIIKKFFNIKTLAIIVDKYNFMNPSREKISQKVYFHLLKKVSCFAFVTDYLESLINEEKKDHMILEGLVSKYDNADEFEPGKVGNYCLYAGGLHSIYGVKTLVDAFHSSSVDYSLYLYGNGDAIEYIKEISDIDKRIKYMGIASHEEIISIEKNAKILINPRPVHGYLDTRYNFPSKLMEYMQSGRPVITTRLLGIPKEYDEYMFYFEDEREETIRAEIERVLKIDENILKEYGQKARKYVLENKNNVLVGKKLFKLLNMGGPLE